MHCKQCQMEKDATAFYAHHKAAHAALTTQGASHG